MAAHLSRIEVKENLTAELRLSKFASPTHLIVISQPGPIDKQDITAIETKASRFIGKPGEWYFIAIYSDVTGDHSRVGMISHESLYQINQSKKTWRIPIALCQHILEWSRPCGFDLYQTFKPQPALTIVNIEKAFEMRKKLYTWLQASTAYQDKHPLTSTELLYLGVSHKPKHYDKLVYIALCLSIPKFMEGRMKWIHGETAILRHRLLMRPDLKDIICETAGVPISFQGAFDSAVMFHKEICEHFVICERHPFFNDPQLVELAEKFHRGLVHEQITEIEDMEVQKSIKTTEALYKRTSAPTEDDRMSFIDVVDCAPECMNRLLRRLNGTTQQKARLLQTERRAANYFLSGLGMQTDTIIDYSRPKIMIEYEKEDPILPWNQIQALAVKTASDQAMDAASDDVKGKGFQSCYDMMSAGWCPFNHKPQPPAKGAKKIPWEQRQAQNKRAYSASKGKCHDRLVELHRDRMMYKQSSGHKIAYERTAHPIEYTMVAFYGDQMNTAKQRKITLKAQQTKKRKATQKVEQKEKKQKLIEFMTATAASTTKK